MPDADQVTSQPDRCAFCLGWKGGEYGKENTLQGVLVCDPCMVLLLEIMEAVDRNTVRDVEPEAGDDELIANGLKLCREHGDGEASGEIKSQVTPFGGTVTDPDEREMYEHLKEQNVTVCGTCYLTGIVDSTGEWCSCPAGVFAAKRHNERNPITVSTK